MNSCNSFKFKENFRNSNNKQNNGKLNKQEFLKFLKRQQQLNIREGIISPKNNVDNSNINSNQKEIYNNNLNNITEEGCKSKTQDNCSNNEGCVWSFGDAKCKDLNVTFYTSEGASDISFKLPVGNYDKSKIDKFIFRPMFMAVPLGLRVKIWDKEGFAGNNLGFLGNNQKKQTDNLFPIKNLGSLQICNMVNCVKPSEYSDMTLINLIDGNNIDHVENDVKNLGEYKEHLRNKIFQKLSSLRESHNNCINLVNIYLEKKEIDINKDLSEEDNTFNLQKILNELNNIPDCKFLKDNIKILVNSPTISPTISKINAPKNSPSYEWQPEDIFPAPSFINNDDDNVNTINIIILIFVSILILFLILVLLYFYIKNKQI